MKALSLRRADASRSVFAEGRPLVDVKAIFSRQFLDQLLMQRYADRQERCGCIDLALGDRDQLLDDRLHIFLDILDFAAGCARGNAVQSLERLIIAGVAEDRTSTSMNS